MNPGAGMIMQFPAEELAIRTAERIVQLLFEAIQNSGKATVALSGGSTPKDIYTLLGGNVFRAKIDWTKVHFFWGDERCVPPTHAESNFRMADEALLQRIAVPPGNIHRVRGELPAADAAAQYEEDVRTFFGTPLPVFDLVLLGLGEDGHTASIFPGTTIVTENRKPVAAVYVPQLNSFRVSLTLPAINAARAIMFIVAGKSKATIVRDVLQGSGQLYPAQLVKPTNGRLFWLLDDDAASRLKGEETSTPAGRE